MPGPWLMPPVCSCHTCSCWDSERQVFPEAGRTVARAERGCEYRASWLQPAVVAFPLLHNPCSLEGLCLTSLCPSPALPLRKKARKEQQQCPLKVPQALRAPHTSSQQLITRDAACFRPNLPSSHTPSVTTVCCEVSPPHR